MSSIVLLILAGTAVSTAIKVGILAVWVKTYRTSRQDSPDPAVPGTRRKRLRDWITRRSPPHTVA